MKEAINTTITKKNIDTVNKTDISQASNKTVDTSSSNKSDKVKFLDKSRSNQRTDTENIFNTVNKSRSVQTKAANYISLYIEEYLNIKVGNRIDFANAILKNEKQLKVNQECIIA